MSNLAAFTQTKFNDYPGYASLNRSGTDAVTLTVRTPEQGGQQLATVDMSIDEAGAFVAEAYTALLGAPIEAVVGEVEGSALSLLQEVHAWRNAERQGAFPDDLRQRIAALVDPDTSSEQP